MKRRDFVKKAGGALALAALTGGTGLIFYNRDTSKYQNPIAKIKNFEVPPNLSFPGVTICRDEDHIKALNRSLDTIGGIRRFIKPGERVTIKPNIGWDRTPQQAANTNPTLVAEMVRLCLTAGATEVVVTDITCNEARRTFIRSGIREAAEKAGAKVILPSDEDYILADLGGDILTTWPVMKYFIDTDRLINMPIVKQHSLSTCTIGMKNLYGIIGGNRSRLHQRIDQSIVDLAAYARPTLTVVDATRVLLRNGPQGGSLADVAIENSVICATDQVAADSRAVEFLGVAGWQVGHITLAEKFGLGKTDYNAVGYREITA